MDSGANLLQVLAAFAFVVALIFACGAAFKRFGLPLMAAKAPNGARLAVVETRMLDARRKLVLVRRDEVEHLLLIGQETQIVVESDIMRKERGE